MSDLTSLDKLKQIVSSEIVESYIPSTGATAKFYPLNIKQQKEIIKTAVDGLLASLTFSIATNDIIKTNAIEQKDYLVTDKPLILLNLRRKSVGDTVTLTKEDKEFKTTITSITTNANTPTSFDHPPLTEGDISLTTKIPTLSEDTKINLEVKKLFDKFKDEQKLSEVIGELFVIELIKYVKEINFKSGTDIIKIDFNTLSFDQKLKTFETLPMSLNYKLVKYVTSTRETELKLLEVVDGQEKYNITIDSAFFFKE
jgi:predicted nucleic-acid-binding protein